MVKLKPQLVPGVQVLTLEDDGERSIGIKRQRILEQATGRYICFFDDDDLPSDDYVSRVVGVIAGEDPPDLIGFRLKYIVDGHLDGLAVHSYNASKMPVNLPNRGMRRMDRLPNHLNPVRRELALRCGGFRDLNFGEDGDYAHRLAQLRPRPREVFIDAHLYEYWYRSKRPGERTNAMRTVKR